MTPITQGLTLFLALLLATAGYQKLSDLGAYAELVSDYLGHDRPRPAIALGVGLLELVLALMLLLSPLLPSLVHAIAHGGTAALLVVYAAGMRRLQLASGGRARCGCGGSNSGLRAGPALMVRNAVLAVLALALIPVGGGWPDAVVPLLSVAMVAVFALLLNVCAETLIANSQNFREVSYR